MPAIMVACYPRPADNKYRFDLDYYITKHMPLQMKHHGPHGLRTYHIITPADDSPYVIQCIEFWDNLEGVEKAIKESSAELWEDIPKYTDILCGYAVRGEVKAGFVPENYVIKGV